jgi:MFS family permease
VTVATPPTAGPESLLDRLGIPKLDRNGKFISATAIDSIGTGLILAFTVVYFAVTTDVSLPAIGAAITLARLLALPTSITVGPLIDRFSARRTAAGGNLVSAVGYVGFLFAHETWSIVLVVFLVQVGHTTYWTSSAALIALAAPADLRPRWFSFAYALRNAGMGLGGALGAFALAIGEVNGLHLITICNAASFVAASVLLAAWRPPRHDAADGPDPAPATVTDPALVTVTDPAPVTDAAPATVTVPVTGADIGPGRPAERVGYLTVLRDRGYTMLIGINVTLVFAQMLIKVLLAIYIVEALDEGAWIAGTLIVLSTIQIALTQTIVNRRMEHHGATRLITFAALLNAAAFGLFALLYVAPDFLVVGGLFVAMVVFTFGEMIGFPAIDNLSVAMAPQRIQGRYLAVYQLSWTVGEIVAPIVLTFLLVKGATLPMIFLLVLSLAALPLLAALQRRTAVAGDPARPAASELTTATT